MKILKKVVIALLLLSMLLTLCACGKFKCALCGEEKKGKSYKEEVFGREIKICRDCYEIGEEIDGEINDIIVDIGDLFE